LYNKYEFPPKIINAIKKEAKVYADDMSDQISDLMSDNDIQLSEIIEDYISENDIDSMDVYEVYESFVEAYLAKEYINRAKKYMDSI
jgi:DNA integrity scanning protein DisA with diadenylate cyclase activity